MAHEIDGIKFEQRHGKARVRVGRVWKSENGRHSFAEWNVSVSLLSDCLPAYFQGDNSNIVATDTMKNTVNLSLSLYFCLSIYPSIHLSIYSYVCILHGILISVFLVLETCLLDWGKGDLDICLFCYDPIC